MNKIFDLNSAIPTQCLLLGKRVAQIVDERLTEIGLSSAKMQTLHSIATTEEIVTVTCLAETMDTSKSNVTAMIDRLIGEGLVTRQHSLEDRRTVIIALTLEGQRLYAEGAEMLRLLHVELAERFTAQEQQFLSSVLAKLP